MFSSGGVCCLCDATGNGDDTDRDVALAAFMRIPWPFMLMSSIICHRFPEDLPTYYIL